MHMIKRSFHVKYLLEINYTLFACTLQCNSLLYKWIINLQNELLMMVTYIYTDLLQSRLYGWKKVTDKMIDISGNYLYEYAKN
jgi:hypothetical protein